jgi:hypothetical protein
MDTDSSGMEANPQKEAVPGKTWAAPNSDHNCN